MILDDEYLYESILERMPYFSLKRLYYDIGRWNDNISDLDEEYSNIYNTLNKGEFVYEPENNNIYSTVPISDMYNNKLNGVYVTNMDEATDFIDYCKLCNAHPVKHPIYTRTILLDEKYKFNNMYQFKYCRPSNIKGWNLVKTYDENDIERIKEIYPSFDMRYIYNVVMTFGFYSNSNTLCEYLHTTKEPEDDNIIGEITNIYAFGPNDDNIGKSIGLSMDA